jgi:hypothetical protein
LRSYWSRARSRKKPMRNGIVRPGAPNFPSG